MSGLLRGSAREFDKVTRPKRILFGRPKLPPPLPAAEFRESMRLYAATMLAALPPEHAPAEAEAPRDQLHGKNCVCEQCWKERTEVPK